MKIIVSSINLAEIQFKQNRDLFMRFENSYDGNQIGNISFIGIKKFEILSNSDGKNDECFPLFFCDMIITRLSQDADSDKPMYDIQLLGCLEMEISIICRDLRISDVVGQEFECLSTQIKEQYLTN
jgi:hypothetical protein